MSDAAAQSPTPRAATCAIGDELLDGRVVDTNSAEIASRLLELGIDCVRAVVSGDPVDEIVRSLRFCLEVADIVLVTGGIGPTEDDRTRDAVAKLAGVDLIENAAAWRRIEEWFEERGATARGSNRRQALFPRGANVLDNPLGTAPGFALELADDKRIFVMPGVPSEMRKMFDEQVVPQLASGPRLHQRTLLFSGIGESRLGERIADELREGGDVRVGITSSWGLLRVTVRATQPRVLEATCESIRERGLAWFAGEGYREIEEVLVERLRETGTSVALAESCTAGLASARLGRVPGVSAVLLESVVTYSNASKVARLGVPETLIDEHGAVSEQVAIAMAKGLAASSGAHLTGAITGVAGPDGGTVDKPVGLVWLASCLNGEVHTLERRYGAIDRNAIRERAAADILRVLLEHHDGRNKPGTFA